MVCDITLNTGQQRLPQVRVCSYWTQQTDNFRDLDFSLCDYKNHRLLDLQESFICYTLLYYSELLKARSLFVLNKKIVSLKVAPFAQRTKEKASEQQLKQKPSGGSSTSSSSKLPPTPKLLLLSFQSTFPHCQAPSSSPLHFHSSHQPLP